MPATPVCHEGFAYPPEQLPGNQVVLVGVLLLVVQLLTPPPPDATSTSDQFEITVEFFAALHSASTFAYAVYTVRRSGFEQVVFHDISGM